MIETKGQTMGEKEGEGARGGWRGQEGGKERGRERKGKQCFENRNLSSTCKFTNYGKGKGQTGCTENLSS